MMLSIDQIKYDPEFVKTLERSSDEEVDQNQTQSGSLLRLSRK